MAVVVLVGQHQHFACEVCCASRVVDSRLACQADAVFEVGCHDCPGSPAGELLRFWHLPHFGCFALHKGPSEAVFVAGFDIAAQHVRVGSEVLHEVFGRCGP